MLKIPTFCLVVGHTKDAKGAAGAFKDKKQYEYEFNCALAIEISLELLNLGAIPKVVYRDSGGINGAYIQVNDIMPTACVELHFNAFNGKASGTETLYSRHNRHSAKLADLMQSGMAVVLEREGSTDRGVKCITAGDRGFLGVSLAKCPSVLIEPFFGDNVDECALVEQYRDDLVKSIASSLVGFWTAKRRIL